VDADARLWFELRVLWCFLSEIVRYPTLTSWIEVDAETGEIRVIRGR
jgi:hypothetical protein